MNQSSSKLSAPVDLTADSQPDEDVALMLETNPARNTNKNARTLLINESNNDNNNHIHTVEPTPAIALDAVVRRKRIRSHEAIQSRDGFATTKRDAIATTLTLIRRSHSEALPVNELQVLVEDAVMEYLMSNPDVVDPEEIAEGVYLTLFGEMPGLHGANTQPSLPVYKAPHPPVTAQQATLSSSSSSSSAAKSPFLNDGFEFVPALAPVASAGSSSAIRIDAGGSSGTATSAGISKSQGQPMQRQCHNCLRVIIKADNCNMLRCPCGASQCFLCRADTSTTKAKHFCQIVFCTHRMCGGCQLFSSAEDEEPNPRDSPREIRRESHQGNIQRATPAPPAAAMDLTAQTQDEAAVGEEDLAAIAAVFADPGDYDDDPVLLNANATIPPLQEVLVIFPNADQTHVTRLLVQYMDNVPMVVQDMIEKGYPKHKRESLTSSSSSQSAKQSKDFTSTGWETSAVYRDCAIVVLCNLFPFIRKESMHRHFATCKFRYSVTIDSLETELQVTAGSVTKRMPTGAEYDAVKGGMDKLGLTFKQPSQTMLKQSMDPVLEEEIAWLRAKRVREAEEKDRALAVQLNESLAEETGAQAECGCCCGDFAFDNIVQCSEGHLFCKRCVQKYVEETVFGNGKSHVKCITSETNCEGFFPDSMLRQALPETTFQKYQEAVARDVVSGAQIPLVTCCKCSLQVELEESAGIVLVCPSCTQETCRLCGEEAHIPLRCSEVEKKTQTNARLTVEEAMTEARLRLCRKCKTKFYKTEGCNKMTCTCGAILCYICRADISKIGYAHFCQAPHCDHSKCNKCKLFSDSTEDDRIAMYEAGLTALHTVAAAPAAGTNAPGAANANEPAAAAPQVDIETLLEGGAIKKKKAKPNAGVPVVIDMPHAHAFPYIPHLPARGPPAGLVFQPIPGYQLAARNHYGYIGGPQAQAQAQAQALQQAQQQAQQQAENIFAAQERAIAARLREVQRQARR